MASVTPAKLKKLQLAEPAKRAAQLERVKPIMTYWREYHCCYASFQRAC